MRAFVLLAAVVSAVGMAVSTAPRPTGAASVASGPDTRLMVLRLADVPSGFVRKGGHYVSNAQARAEDKPPKRDYDAQLGRLNGYSATYWSESAYQSGGLDLIVAGTNLYRSGALAHERFLSGAQLADADKTVHRVVVGKSLGDEARLYTSKYTAGGVTIQNYALGWRSGAVMSEISAAGRAGSVDPAEIVALGLKQQARIASAIP